MLIQYGLPGIGITENRIAQSKFLGCECGLDAFIPCYRRSACIGYVKAVVSRKDVRESIAFSVWATIKGVFPEATVITGPPAPRGYEGTGAGFNP